MRQTGNPRRDYRHVIVSEVGTMSGCGDWILRAARRLRAGAASGQAAVETALVFTILVPVIIGAVDLGRAYFAYDVLVHAVNEGARQGSFDSNSSNVVATVQAADGPLNLQPADVTVACYAGSSSTAKTCSAMIVGDSVRVTANVLFTPLTPLITAILPSGTLTLSATAQRSFQ
jgi:Flp pilus assembly protein TadG